MKHLHKLATIGAAVLLWGLASTSANAVSVTMDQCTSGQCVGFSGTVDAILSLVPGSGDDDLLVDVTNNLDTGGITRVSLTFGQVFTSASKLDVTVLSGTVKIDNVSVGTSNGGLDIDITSIGGNGDDAFGPSERVSFLVDTDPDVADLTSAYMTAYIQGACGAGPCDQGPVGGPNSYQVSGYVPVPAAVWLFGSGLLGLVGIARRKKAA